MFINLRKHCLYLLLVLPTCIGAQTNSIVVTTSKSIENASSAKNASSTDKTVKPIVKTIQIIPTGNIEVKNMKILNGSKDDFSPLYFEGGILFCSNSRKVKKGADPDKIPDDLNLKYAMFDSTGQLMKALSFGKRTNSKTHEGPSCFSKSGDTMFLTRNMSKSGIDKKSANGEYTLKIYIKTRDSLGSFVGDKLLPFELENYTYCHPSLSADGKRLFFSSNMPGGFGGMDLYMIRKINDTTWTSPINLGPRINTSKNEVFPYMTEKGILYFASNGHLKGKGGLDMYGIEIDKRNGVAMTLDGPFNTEGDDFGIIFLPNNPNKGFFSSNRIGGQGGDDIYEFEAK